MDFKKWECNYGCTHYVFIIFNLCGWLMEVILVSIKTQKITDRGFLMGPYCPIYGFGALIITIFLNRYLDDPVALFVMSCLTGAILEYFSSYMMEKIFQTRWWDYSEHKYNLNGRISLTTTLGFGALGLILCYVFNPFFINLLNDLSSLTLTILTIILALIFLTDCLISFKIISSIKKIDLTGTKDATDEITARVKEILKSKSFFNKRLVIAFPNFKVKFAETKEKIEKIYHKKV